MIDEDDNNLEDYQIEELNLDEIIKNLHNYSMIQLCDIVICDRYLGFSDKLATVCMEELGMRRENGDTFDFEAYIEREYNALPKLDFSIADVQSSIIKIISGFKR